MQLLIVDDEAAIVEELVDYVTGHGACAEIAHRAADALERLHAHPEIAVLLSDIRLPGDTGLGLLAQALAGRDEANALEVVLMTGHATIEDAIAAVQRKAFDFVRKPFSMAVPWQSLERANASALTRRAAAAAREKTDQDAADGRAMLRDLGAAIDKGHLAVHFQPQVDLATGALSGAEALLRWNRPGHGLVSPGQFIEAAEESGLILRIGHWVPAEACSGQPPGPRISASRSMSHRCSCAIPASTRPCCGRSAKPGLRHRVWNWRSPKGWCCTTAAKSRRRCGGCAISASGWRWMISAPDTPT